MHERAAFVEFAQIDGCEAELSGQGRHGPDRVLVYLPQSYNFAGQLLVAERGSVQPLDLESSRALALVVSGGVSGSPEAAVPAGARDAKRPSPGPGAARG